MLFRMFAVVLGFLRDTTSGEPVKNAIVADYTNLNVQCNSKYLEDLLHINREVRDNIEASESEKVAMQICSRLPKNEDEIESMLETGYELARKMSWDMVVKHYLLNSLKNMTAKQRAA